ncbi:MAG: SCPU domain-containing protein [Mesorhizobium sp.]|nr:MAG: SCPU domain-containing protein [Mesorhizobium sp.]
MLPGHTASENRRKKEWLLQRKKLAVVGSQKVGSARGKDYLDHLKKIKDVFYDQIKIADQKAAYIFTFMLAFLITSSEGRATVQWQRYVDAGGSVSATRTIYARVLGNQQSVGSGLYRSQFSGSQTRIVYGEVATFNCAISVGGSFRRATFSVQANVAANCSVTAQNINFGNRGVLDAVDGIGGVGVTCTPGTAYNVGLNNGQSGTGPTARRMTLGGEAVTYGLYKDCSAQSALGWDHRDRHRCRSRRGRDAEPARLWPRAGAIDAAPRHLHRHRCGHSHLLTCCRMSSV